MCTPLLIHTVVATCTCITRNTPPTLTHAARRVTLGVHQPETFFPPPISQRLVERVQRQRLYTPLHVDNVNPSALISHARAQQIPNLARKHHRHSILLRCRVHPRRKIHVRGQVRRIDFMGRPHRTFNGPPRVQTEPHLYSKARNDFLQFLLNIVGHEVVRRVSDHAVNPHNSYQGLRGNNPRLLNILQVYLSPESRRTRGRRPHRKRGVGAARCWNRRDRRNRCNTVL